ncbi:hypothetical protein D5086_009292 [Populus alba]|uniref:Uncharacterized protein n=1 Tax=Populus alba TaxID=43335 RepID=A0ACC4CIH7_POPAL
MKGSKLVESDTVKIEVFWDLSSAKYELGPEPVEGFYVLVMVDSEIGLILGDVGEETLTKKFKTSSTPIAKATLISRQEHCSGNTLYATRAQFCDTGIQHDIVIRCSGENEGLKHPVLSVCIDKKTVIRVKRLQWNFRGNQTIFLDGLLVDLLWDVHDWFYNPGSGYAVFMFRTRSGMDSRLWLEEKLVQKDQERITDWSSLCSPVYLKTPRCKCQTSDSVLLLLLLSLLWISHSSWTFYSASLLDYRARGELKTTPPIFGQLTGIFSLSRTTVFPGSKAIHVNAASALIGFPSIARMQYDAFS